MTKIELLKKYPHFKGDVDIAIAFYEHNAEKYFDKILQVLEKTKDKSAGDFCWITKAFHKYDVEKYFDKILIAFEKIKDKSGYGFCLIAKDVFKQRWTRFLKVF